MSSEEQPSSSNEPVSAVKARSKKRRVQTVRACERCRSKKTRCDGMPGGQPCSQCVTAEARCEFSDKPKRRHDRAYIDGLEAQLQRVQHLLERLHPGEDFTNDLDGSEHILQLQQTSTAPTHSVLAVATEIGVDSGSHAAGKRKAPEFRATSSDAEDKIATSRWPSDVIDALRENQTGTSVGRYYGESPGARMFNTALDIHSKLEGTGRDVMERAAQTTKMRTEFWKPQPWELEQLPMQRNRFVFPEPDMFMLLTNTYFKTSHLVAPILHQGAFEADLATGKHLRDEAFGSVVLLVCAIGARMSDDPRVLLDRSGKTRHLHSAGVEWYDQVQLVRNAALAAPTLHDLQAVTLGAAYAVGTSPAHSSWILGSTGIRMALDMDIRRQHKAKRHTLEVEQWKRAFWLLVFLDVWNSSFLGRPTAIALDSFDVDFPTDVDDRYWMDPDPTKAFVQPPGEYSRAGHFLYALKINLIHAHALRTIYSPDKDRSVAKLGREEWERRVTTELDSALSRWADSLPEYLQWNEVLTEPGVESNQQKILHSSILHLLYQYTRITIHRPFVVDADRGSQFSLPSLTICTSAARAVVHVIKAQRRILPSVVLQVPIIPSFMAGTVLLLRVWFAKRAGMRVDSLADMKYVFDVIQFLDEAEHRWGLAGRLKDLLLALVDVGQLPLPPRSSLKRPRGEAGQMLPLQMSVPAAAPGSRRPADAAQSDSHRRTNIPAEGLPQSASSETFAFGPPLAPRPDGLYPFDPASSSMSGASSYISEAGNGASRKPSYHVDASRSQPHHPYPMSYPPVPLNPSTTHPSALYAPSQPHQYYLRATDDYTAIPNYNNPHSTVEAYNTAPSSSYSPNMDDSQFMNMVTPAMARDAPMANMWSSLPVTFQPDHWVRYVSTMAAYARDGNEQQAEIGQGYYGQSGDTGRLVP